jgi:hypothetical protein
MDLLPMAAILIQHDRPQTEPTCCTDHPAPRRDRRVGTPRRLRRAFRRRAAIDHL